MFLGSLFFCLSFFCVCDNSKSNEMILLKVSMLAGPDKKRNFGEYRDPKICKCQSSNFQCIFNDFGFLV